EMGFIYNSKFRAVVVLAFIVGIGLANRAFSQEVADSVAQPADTAAVAATDTAAAATDTTAATSDTVASSTASTGGTVTAGGTAAGNVAEESGTNIDPQVYMNFFYGL